MSSPGRVRTRRSRSILQGRHRDVDRDAAWRRQAAPASGASCSSGQPLIVSRQPDAGSSRVLVNRGPRGRRDRRSARLDHGRVHPGEEWHSASSGGSRYGVGMLPGETSSKIFQPFSPPSPEGQGHGASAGGGAPDRRELRWYVVAPRRSAGGTTSRFDLPRYVPRRVVGPRRLAAAIPVWSLGQCGSRNLRWTSRRKCWVRIVARTLVQQTRNPIEP